MRFAILTTAVLAATALQAQTSSLIDGMRGQDRPVLLFAPAADRLLPAEYTELVHHTPELRNCQMRIVLITHAPIPASEPTLPGTVSATDVEAASLRTRFHVTPHRFTLVLIGKDGGEKFRSSAFVPLTTLAALIDTMPMRQQEMHSR